MKITFGVLLVIGLIIVIVFMIVKQSPPKSYSAILHTEKGDITIALHSKETPKTVNNFVSLAQKKFYSGTPFHRVIRGVHAGGGSHGKQRP